MTRSGMMSRPRQRNKNGAGANQPGYAEPHLRSQQTPSHAILTDGARQRVVDNRFMKASEKLFKLRVEGPMGCDAQALGSKDLQADTDIQS